MKHYHYLAVLWLLWVVVCPLQAQTTSYRLMDEMGIFVEQYEPGNNHEDRYTADNQVFQAGKSYTYRYCYVNQWGDEFLYRSTKDKQTRSERAWHLVPIQQEDDTTVYAIKMTVEQGLQGFNEMQPDFSRTIINYDYLTASGKSRYSEMTGLVENEKNIWLNPPRMKLFRILQLNPYPFIQAPYEVGKTWEWSQKISSYWGDERWKNWEGTLTNHYLYRIAGKKTIETPFGNLECYEIQAKATSEIGETYLTALFHPQYGFVKLSYTNIDGTKLMMNLIEAQ